MDVDAVSTLIAQTHLQTNTHHRWIHAMEISHEEHLENVMIADFSVSVEKSMVSSRQKRLCIRRGRHTESVPLNPSEAQLVMLSLMNAFPGALSELLEAARPLSDALNGDGRDLIDKIHGVQAAIDSLDAMLAATPAS
ncbi:hypothetical protein [Pseudomonas serbica]|uniref:hypothetical protein n=1 Tax=Pseudomonas serbica TaxID=2965074 RepID=UPI00237BAD8B|nr:hypothetical protein [Pseudomonas serbica]